MLEYFFFHRGGMCFHVGVHNIVLISHRDGEKAPGTIFARYWRKQAFIAAKGQRAFKDLKLRLCFFVLIKRLL